MNLSQLQDEVAQFNAAYPIGSRVAVRMDSGQVRIATTRAPAQVLSRNGAVVWLDGIYGAFALERVTRVREGVG